MASLQAAVAAEAARTSFSGVVRVDRGAVTEVASAYGFADRAHGIEMTPDHQVGTASLTKGFTALTVMSLVADGAVSLSTRARSVLGDRHGLAHATLQVEPDNHHGCEEVNW